MKHLRRSIHEEGRTNLNCIKVYVHDIKANGVVVGVANTELELGIIAYREIYRSIWTWRPELISWIGR